MLAMFVNEPIKANHTIVAELYTNALQTNFGEKVTIMIREVRVYFSSAAVNVIYVLPELTTWCLKRDFESWALSG